MRRTGKWTAVLLAWALGLCDAYGVARADAGWRGDGTGRFPTATPPLHWGLDHGVVWSTALPAQGNSMPAITADHLFLTAEPTTLLALRPSDGQILWQRVVTYLDTLDAAGRKQAAIEQAAADAVARELALASRELDRLRRDARKRSTGPEVKSHIDELSHKVGALRGQFEKSARFRSPEDIPTVGNASATPITDGRNVYAIFGNFVVASFTGEGALRWARYLPPTDPSMHGYAKGQSASPLLDGKTLVVPLGKLRGLDADTGRTLWESDDYRDYGTPALAHLGGTTVVVTPDGHAVRARDGKLLSRALGMILYVGPIVSGDVAYLAGNTSPEQPNPATATAYRLVLHGADLAPSTLYARKLPNQRHYATPVLVDHTLVLVDDRPELTFLDADDGHALETRAIGQDGETFPSPTLAGNYLYVTIGDGTTLVLEAHRPFREVARNHLAPLRASPVFAGRRLYLRTLDRLYCIEEK